MPDVEIRALRIRVEVDEGSLNRSRELIENMVNNLQSKCKLALSIDTKALASSTAGVMSTVTKAATESAAAVEKTTGAAFSEKKLKSFYLAQQKMQLQLNRMGSGASTKEFERFTELLNNVSANGGKGFDELAGAAMRARDSIGALNKEMNNSADVESLRTRLANKLGGGEWLSGQASRLQSSFVDADPALVQAATAKLNEIRQLGDVAQMSESELNALNNALNQYNALMNAVGASNAANRSLREQATALANLRSQYQSYMTAYGKNLSKNIPLMNRFMEFGRNLSSGSLNSGDAARQFAELRAQAQAAGVEVETTGQRMHNLFSTHFNTAIIMYALYGLRTLIRQLWRDIKDLNDALVQVQIVTGRSGASLRNYVEDAYAVAEKSKDKVTNILEEATAYGRLGYDSDLSMQLAELTSMYGKIGDVDTQEATDAITALMKAFNLEDATEIEDALDKMIYVGNNFPISAAGLGESMNNAASALSSAGNTLEESLAMLMVANETVQNPSKSSTAMRTITARIRNSKAELDELGEEMEEKWNTVAKYREALLGVSGVDILDATGKEFKSTADILSELAAAWQNLSSVERATVTTMVAGTRNQDIWASLMANWGDYEKAMAGMGDAGGLMQDKFSAVEQSLSGSLTSLSNAFSQFSNTLINSNDISALIKGLTGLLGVMSSLVKTMGGGAFAAGTLAMVSFFSKMRAFSATWPSMQAAMSSLSGMYAGTGNILNAQQLQAATTALAGFTNAQQRAIMTGAGLPTAAQAQILTLQGMSTAGLGASGAMSTLGASIDGLKVKMTAFVQSGNVWITIIMLLAQVIMGIVNMINENEQAAEQAAEEAKRKAEEARQEARDAIRKTNEAYNSGSTEADNYQSKLNELADKLDKATVGSNEYKEAKVELYGVQKDIIEQFGVEAAAINATTEELRAYAKELDEVAERKLWEELFKGENYEGLKNALEYFGFTPEGQKKSSNGTMTVPIDYQTGISWTGNYSWWGSRATWQNEDKNSALSNFIRRIIPGAGWNASWAQDYSWVYGFLDEPSLLNPSGTAWISDNATITGIQLYADNIIDLVDQLEDRLVELRKEGRTEDAAILSEWISQIKEGTEYESSVDLFNRWVVGQLKWGNLEGGISEAYRDVTSAIEGYNEAIAAGDVDKAREYLALLFGEMDPNDAEQPYHPGLIGNFNKVAEEYGYDFAKQYMSILTKAFGNPDLMMDLASGDLWALGNMDEYFKKMREGNDEAERTLAILKQMSNGGAVELWNRPIVSWQDMRAAGYDVPEDSYSTVDSYTAGYDGVYMNFTPILPDGTVLDSESFYDYMDSVIDGGEDYLGLKIGPTYDSEEAAVNAAIAAHEASEAWYDGLKDQYNPMINQQDILNAGKLASLEEAREASLEREWLLYQNLVTAAQAYGVTVEDMLRWLSLFYNIPATAADARNRTFISDPGKPKNYDSSYAFTGQDTVTQATGRVGALDTQTTKYLQASSAFYDATEPIYQEWGENPMEYIDVDAAKEAIDLVNDYFGTSFEEVNEDNFDVIQAMLEAAGEEIYGAVSGSVSDALQFVQDNADEYGIDMGDIIDVDTGMINIAALNAALATIPYSADQAGASAAGALAEKLRTVAGMKFTLVQDGDSIKVVASDGYMTPPPGKSGGGGGGKKSKISDDIENVERMIDLFKKLLNYYEEGSDQWIARQTQLIDKYKAGVEIAMNEYRRLKAKGLKETDDDVKKIVDTILEYQDSIYEESEKLWEAVRQNQIDSLKHLKDQNDAAIDLEETHHDLLIAIRDERRELEDELKAARDAYSEVMTPEELDAMFSVEDYAELMDKLATIEGDAMSMYRDYKEQIAAVSEDETYMIEHITDEFKRQYELKMKEYEITKAELGVKRAQQELENVKNEQTVMMLIGGKWQWVADPEKVLEAEQNLADAEQELADAQDEFNFQSLINEMEAQSSGIQQQIDALEALTFSMDDLAEQIHLFSDSVYKELLTYLSQIAQGIFDKYEGDTAVPAFAEGGVIKRGGLAMVHSGEPIFSTADAEKLWRFVHDLGDTPVNTLGVYSGIANKLLDSGVDTLGGVSTVAIDNSINIPGGIHVHGEMAQQLITLLKEVVAPYQPTV